MPRYQLAAALALAAIGFVTPARACAVHEPLNLADARNADVVVIGRISAQRVWRTPPVFTVSVDQVLAGRVARSFRIDMEPGAVVPQAMLRGPALIALRRSPAGGLAVMQHICSDPFIVDARGDQARRVRAILARRR
ncbi:MAG TPA: hypothetical protein VMG08_19290 [Allosphingosinicella sp.]|nr:hypothetical protein [Allosphingosinicella sp.]